MLFVFQISYGSIYTLTIARIEYSVHSTAKWSLAFVDAIIGTFELNDGFQIAHYYIYTHHSRTKQFPIRNYFIEMNVMIPMVFLSIYVFMLMWFVINRWKPFVLFCFFFIFYSRFTWKLLCWNFTFFGIMALWCTFFFDDQFFLFCAVKHTNLHRTANIINN